MSTSENPAYVVYIDEAGDTGLTRVKPLDERGASEWLILGAVVVRIENDPLTHEWVQVLTRGFRGHQRFGIHFTDLNPAKKLLVCERMRDLPIRCFAMVSNKKNMKGYENPWAEQIPSKNWFYCWLTRLLLERVTDFVEADGVRRYGEPRPLKIIYSERGGISYDQMNAYYTWLSFKSSSGRLFLPLGDLKWSVMRRELLEVRGHNERAGLHLADAVASAFFKACDIYDTGGCDPQYAKLLEPRMGRIPDMLDGEIAGYGLKLMPGFRSSKMTRDQEKIFRFYGYPRQWWAPVPSTP
jgi:hypothetical protein